MEQLEGEDTEGVVWAIAVDWLVPNLDAPVLLHTHILDGQFSSLSVILYNCKSPGFVCQLLVLLTSLPN